MTTEQPVATARRFLHRRLVGDVVALVVGGLILAAGIAGVVYLGQQSDELTSSGIHASANVTEVDNYHSRFQFDEHVDVSFRIAGVVVVARCYTAPGDDFVIGESVAIVYDTNNPLHAQLVDDPNPGPIIAPFFGALVLGLLIVLPGAYGLFVRRGMTAALREPGRPMTAVRSSWRRITLRDNEVELAPWMRGQLRRFPSGEPVTAQVFGDSILVVVHPDGDAVAFGRKPKAAADADQEHPAKVE